MMEKEVKISLFTRMVEKPGEMLILISDITLMNIPLTDTVQKGVD